MSIATDLAAILATEPVDLSRAALTVARIEYPGLDIGESLQPLDRLGALAADRLADLPPKATEARIAALNALVFEEHGFAGNRANYGDFRNSLLNVVLDRRLGIPITLALVYMEVARRAGLGVLGVAFPGHFLMRVPAIGGGAATILDPFDGGARMDQAACRRLLSRHLGALGDEVPLDWKLLDPCTPQHLIARLLNNLKRTYVESRSFPQARLATDLLLAVDPSLLSERRDRGLIAYHLDDYPSALRDLEDYLRLGKWDDDDDRKERDRIWEHVKALRRRVAGMN